ncbi:unnamed protein product [Lactuca saligna]|uniref:Cullin family profile domain-containing protein n=1 Tax=Lactuca saligna TaxID=75948 RepID=A0AA35UTM9_LACSI|nr:unnamed protein product [Lactuca saligna]
MAIHVPIAMIKVAIHVHTTGYLRNGFHLWLVDQGDNHRKSEVQQRIMLVKVFYSNTFLCKCVHSAATILDKNNPVKLKREMWLGYSNRKVIKLHGKYLTYVNDCFINHTLFHKAFKEAFEIFCDKGVARSSSAELLATFCDNILKNGGSEKLNDEAVEDTLEKVVKLLAYISDKDLFAEFYRKKLARRRCLYFVQLANVKQLVDHYSSKHPKEKPPSNSE